MKILIVTTTILCLITLQGQIFSDTEAIIKDAFLTWVKETNETNKEFCTQKQCDENMKPPHFKYDCSLMLKEGLPSGKIIFEDLNGDNIKDGIITADYEPCAHGTWFINSGMVGHLVFFISITKNRFKVIEEPSIIRNAIELGRVKSVENGIISANGASQSDQAGAHEFDIKWSAKFQYKNDQFELISKTKKYPKPKFNND